MTIKSIYLNKHFVNHFGMHYWFKSCPGGYTECCEYDHECENHSKIK